MAQEFRTTVKVFGKVEQVESFYSFISSQFLNYVTMSDEEFQNLSIDEKIYFLKPDINNISGKFELSHDFKEKFILDKETNSCSLLFETISSRKRPLPETWFLDAAKSFQDIVFSIKIYEDCVGTWEHVYFLGECVYYTYEAIGVIEMPLSIGEIQNRFS